MANKSITVEVFLTVRMLIHGTSIGKITQKSDVSGVKISSLNREHVNTMWYYWEGQNNEAPYYLDIVGYPSGKVINKSMEGKYLEFTAPLKYWEMMIAIQPVLAMVNAKLTEKKGVETTWVREKKSVVITPKK